jgi:CTP synthase (UTP-ammonia lyase)
VTAAAGATGATGATGADEGVACGALLTGTGPGLGVPEETQPTSSQAPMGRRSKRMVSIGLIGDYDSKVTAHRAIPLALQLAGSELGIGVDFQWVPTPEITSQQRVSHFQGLWCVPASPYQSMDGALRAIRFARESGRPFLGTCGGFQHAVIEYARNVLGWTDAEHAETTPQAERSVISLLECGLVEVTDAILLKPGTRIHEAYGCEEIIEGYHCRYGLNPQFLGRMTSGSLQVSAHDRAGEVRALELNDHPFFVTSLFQPERAALTGTSPPLARALIAACATIGARN